MTQREKAFFILGMTAVLANFEEPMPNLYWGIPGVNVRGGAAHR